METLNLPPLLLDRVLRIMYYTHLADARASSSAKAFECTGCRYYHRNFDRWRHSRIVEGKNKMRLFDDVTIYNQTSEMNNTPRIVHSNKPPVLSITQISLFRIYQSRLIFCYVPPVYPSRKSPRSLINRDDRRPPDADTSRDRSIARRQRRLVMVTSVRMLAGLGNRHRLWLSVVTACGVGAHMRRFGVGYWRDRC